MFSVSSWFLKKTNRNDMSNKVIDDITINNMNNVLNNKVNDVYLSKDYNTGKNNKNDIDFTNIDIRQELDIAVIKENNTSEED